MKEGFLKAPQRRTQLALTGALLGAAAFLLLYGFLPLNVTNDAWLRGGVVEPDTVQHYAGWLLYRQSPWTFPLGVAQHINWPAGGYVGCTDSIPLFAVFFKLLSPVLPATFQYFGLWGSLCMALQGAAAALLLSLFTQRRLQNAVLSLPFVFAPILLDRLLRHGALGAQWLILFSLYLYIKHRRSRQCFSPGFIALAALSITIHPYFTPMVFAVLFALLVELAITQKQWKQSLLMLGLCLAATALAGFVFGAFSAGSSAGSTPYGYFAMNLNALFNPAARGAHYSLLLPAQNQVLGNFDAFNYLGLGVLIVLACAFVDTLVHWKRWPVWATVKRHAGLLFVCACLFLFAVSNQVTAQGRVLAYIPLPQALLQLAGVFRSSGRLFYPVWYVLLLGACVYVLRRPPVKWQSAAACALAAVQLADLSPALVTKAQTFRPYAAVEASPLQSNFWAQTAGTYTHLASLDEEGLHSAMYLALYATDNGMTTDDAFAARFDPAVRGTQRQKHLAALQGGTFDENTLYITSVEATFLDVAEALDGKLYCAQIDDDWFVFAPYGGGFSGYSGKDAVPIASYPFKITDYSDGLWDAGVLKGDRRIVCFTDTTFARKRLEGMQALAANGEEYPILDIDYGDVGWLLVTLDIDDASVLQGVLLVPVEAV